MGSSSQNTTTSSANGFGAESAPTVQSILNKLNPLIANSGITDAQKAAIDQLTANGQAGNPYAPAIGANATKLLAGGGATNQNGALTDNLNTLKGTLGTYTDPNYSTINSPEVARALQAAQAGVTNQVNSQFAAAGRSGSGMNTQTLAQGTTNAMAPIILDQANRDTATRIGSANTLYGAGNATSAAITGNNQTDLGNRLVGNTAATNALDANNWGAKETITAQELLKSLPASSLGMLAQIGIPIAGLNTTTNGTQNTTSTPSLLQSITGLGGMFSAPAGGTSAVGGMLGSAAGGGAGILGLLGML